MSTDKARTPDGERLRVKDLNVGVADVDNEETGGSPPVATGGLKRLWKNLNLILAGMYTGVGCAGTPHARHSYDDEDGSGASGGGKPDNSPI